VTVRGRFVKARTRVGKRTRVHHCCYGIRTIGPRSYRVLQFGSRYRTNGSGGQCRRRWPRSRATNSTRHVAARGPLEAVGASEPASRARCVSSLSCHPRRNTGRSTATTAPESFSTSDATTCGKLSSAVVVTRDHRTSCITVSLPIVSSTWMMGGRQRPVEKPARRGVLFFPLRHALSARVGKSRPACGVFYSGA